MPTPEPITPLVIRFGAFGDMLLLIPMLKALHRRYGRPCDLERVERDLLARAPSPEALLLVGRRHLRSNNSWMHNSHRLTKGPRRDQLWIHPVDADARSIAEGDTVMLASRVGEIGVTAKVTDRVMAGTVCLPHGFVQGRAGVRLALAAALPGASYNDVSDECAIDPLSGNAAVNALPVSVRKCAA